MKLARLLSIALAVLAALFAGFIWIANRGSDASDRASEVESRPHVATPEPALRREPEAAREQPPTADAREHAEVDKPAQPVVLAGTVLDYSAQNPNEGTRAAGVKVYGKEGFLGGEELAPVVTDVRGRFRIELADPGKRPLRFVLSCDGRDALRGGVSELTLQPGEQQRLEIELRRYPKGDLVGVTVDPEGAPISDVKLVFRMLGATRETSSDNQGVFRLSEATSIQSLKTEREGYLLLDARAPKQVPSGGWDPMRIVLAPVGGLRVSVLNGDGSPLAGFKVSASVSHLERFGPKRDDFDQQLRSSIDAETDPSGTAVLERVWARCRLAIKLDRQGSASLLGEYTQGDTLLFGVQTESSPVVVPPGGEVDLRAIVPPPLRLSGRVEDEAGAPVSKAYLRVESIQTSDAEMVVDTESRAASDGRFEIEIASPRPLHAVRITASDQARFVVLRGHAKVASVDLELRSGPQEEIVLVLRPCLSIRGRMIDLSGHAVRGQVTVYSPGEGPDTPNLRSHSAVTDQDGNFSVNGLAAGFHDVLARPDERLAQTWRRGVEAGREGVEIIIERERAVRVEVEMKVREGEAEKLILLKACLQPRNPSVDAPRLEPATECTGLRGWPEWLVGLWYGSGGRTDPRGGISFASWLITENPTTLLLDEGLYWLGAMGRDKAGHVLFPIGTGLVRVDPGAYRLRFELTAAVPIEGRVRGGDALALAVGIARDGTELLELDVGAPRREHYRPLDADGFFSFAAVPVGENELWIGTAAELAARRPRLRQKLTVDSKGVPFLEVAVAH